MAWFKLNDSLNTLKGQLSTVVQDVFTEGPTEEEQHDPWSLLELANAKCSDYEAEIIALRQQIHDSEHSIKSKPQTDQNVASTDQQPPVVGATATATTEDSWFWESEPTTSATTASSASSASHKDAAGDLTLIPLGATSHPNDEMARLHEYEQTVKQLRIENAVLNEKLGQLSDELRTSGSTVDQLDREHAEAIEELLTLKDGLQTKCKKMEKDMVVLKEEHRVTGERFQQEVSLGENLRAELSAKTDEVEKLLTDAAALAKEREFEFIEKEKTPEITSDHSERIRTLEEQLAVLAASKTEVELKLSQSISQANEQQTELDEIRTSKSELETRLGHIQQQKQEHDLIKLELEFQLKDLRNEYEDRLEVSQSKFTEQLSALQEELLGQDELQRKIADLEDQIQDQNDDNQIEVIERRLLDKETDNDDLNGQLTELMDRHRKLELAHEKLLLDHDQLLDDAAPRNNEEFEQFKANASDCESKLVHENVVLQKQLVDLQSSLNVSRSNSDLPDTTITLGDFGRILQQYVRIDPKNTSFEEIIKYLGETVSSIDRTKKDLDEITEKLEQLTVDKLLVEHEKKTAQADLVHYEIEVAELIKNNEILLLELDALKTGKLETISEQNEENIIQLEQQLEDCSNLNQSLEDEYQDMRDRLADMQRKVREQEMEVSAHQQRLSELSLQLENAETEKSNLAFEIAELKSSEKSTESLDELHAMVITLKAANESLQLKLDADTAMVARQAEEAKAQVDSVLLQLVEKDDLLSKKSSDIDDLLEQLRSARNQDPNSELQNKIAELTQTIHTLQTTPHKSQLAETAELRHILENTIAEKNQLITLITSKHEENSTYHEEIQRLQRLLADEASRPRECPVCPQTAQQLAALRERDEKFTDQVTFLREKADILTANLMTEQGNQTRMGQQRDQLLAEKAELHRDVERLRAHLLEVEESHTQETMELQCKIDEVTMKMGSIETEAKKSSTAYTSASIRANQHNETLQVQYQLLVQQRDDLLTKLSAAEDKESRSEAALVNLQCAIEQFQNDKERDIAEHTQKLRRQLDAESSVQRELRAEMDAMRLQLNEAKNGLLAATRISDQLENYQLANNNLKDELRLHQQKLAAVEQQMADVATSQADKVEKSLLKNLLIGYVVAPNPNDKQQVLKLISSVLDFDAAETDRCGLNRGQGLGWIGAIRNAALVVGNATSPGAPDSYNREGIAQAFVRFLENESQPQKTPATSALLNIVPKNTHTPPSTSASTPSASSGAGSSPSPPLPSSTPTPTSPTPVAVQPIVLNDGLMQHFAPARNSSSILKDILSDS